MEDDYFPISAQESQQLDALGISYRWRDSCLPALKELKTCMQTNPWLRWAYCRELDEKWRSCQYTRERKICAQVNLRPHGNSPQNLG